MFFWATKKKKKKGEKGPAETVFREKPMIFYFHRKLINGRSRHAKNVEIYFAKFIAAYRNHASEWKEFLTDGGKGTPPPLSTTSYSKTVFAVAARTFFSWVPMR